MLESYQKLVRLLSPAEKKGFFILIVIMVAGAVLEMIGVGIIPVYMTAIAFPEQVWKHEWFEMLDNAIALDLKSENVLIIWSSILLVVFFIIKSVFSVFSTYCKVRYAQNRTRKLSVRLFSKYLSAPYTFHIENSTPTLFRNINAECRMLSSKILIPMIELISQALILTGILIVLALSVPGKILAGLVAYLSLGMLVTSIFQKKVRAMGVEAQAHRAKMVKSVKEGLEGVKEIRFMNSAGYFVSRLHNALSHVLDIQRSIMVIQQILPSFVEILVITGLIGITVFLYVSGEGPEAIIPVLAVFTVALARMKGCMRELTRHYTEIRHSSPSLDVIYEALITGPEQEAITECGKGESDRRTRFEKEIRLNKVSYSFPGSANRAVSEADLVIRKGEAIGIVGMTGAGKSTLVDLITGLLPPEEGEILVDNVNIRENLQGWYQNIGYVPQSVFLVDGSVRENITLGIEKENVSAEALDNAIEAARLQDLVSMLPDGVDTVIGDRGKKLSGGEQQRVAIARALYKNPEVLVLDEATSALDNITEAEVIRAVNELKGTWTILVIAHRLSTVRDCDRIAFMNNGRISSIGTFAELRENHADFKSMVNIT